MKPIFIISDNAEGGKDTLAEIMRDELGLTFESSSEFCCKLFIFDKIKDLFGYETWEECFEDRRSSPEMREVWHNLIVDYNSGDLARLSREIFTEYDIYVGIRSYQELQAAISELDPLVIWVDSSKRVPKEGKKSCSVRRDQATIVVDNNGTEEEFRFRAKKICEMLRPYLNQYEGVEDGNFRSPATVGR